jgi:hypothetical protein
MVMAALRQDRMSALWNHLASIFVELSGANQRWIALSGRGPTVGRLELLAERG